MWPSGPAPAGDVELVHGRADEVAGDQTDRLAAAMARPPTAASGVDAATRAALTATPADWAALVAEENRLVDRAERAGGLLPYRCNSARDRRTAHGAAPRPLNS